MTAAAPPAAPAHRDPGAPLWAWLPPHLRVAGARWGFGIRPGAAPRVLHVSGRLWYGDGAAFVDSGIPAIGRRSAGSDLLEGLVAGPREPVPVIVLADRVLVGEAVTSPAYYGLVRELFPEARWSVGWYCSAELSEAVQIAIAHDGPRAVALVMPMRER